MKISNLNKYLIIFLSLTLILGVTGCKETALQGVEAKQFIQDQQKQSEIKPEINPTFETKTYSTPFIKFDFPANWDDSEEVQKYGDKDTIKVIVGDINNATCITVKQKFDNNINSSEQARNQFIKLCDSMQNIEYLDNKSIIKKNITVLEGVVYGKSEIHAKEYFWNNGKGKTYQIEISTDNSDWSNLKEVILVFEKSLVFKK